MLQVRSWPHVILHLDGDAFFASVIQASIPSLKGKALVVGRERGIATAVSYEAKKHGIRRGMTIPEIKRIYPQCIIRESDYELYSLFSRKMFSIMRSFTPMVEEYSIDEAFADLEGLRRPLNMNYEDIGRAIKQKVESSLGVTVSVGISLSKTLAKLASSSQKPSGFTIKDGLSIEPLLKNSKVQDVWGIGQNTGAYLNKYGIYTAYEFVSKPEDFITTHLSKPYYEIWKELRGDRVYEVDPNKKTTYKSIAHTRTFPPTTNKEELWSRLLLHVEEAFDKARRYNYTVGKVSIFLKTQKFHFHHLEITLPQQTSYPLLIHKPLREAFEKIYRPKTEYRAAGCTVSNLSEEKISQSSLFSDTKFEEKTAKVYAAIKDTKIHFGSEFLKKGRMIEKERETHLQLPVIDVNAD